MNSATRKKMGVHAGVSYCIQITKVDGLYFPRIVILGEKPEIIESCEICWIFGASAFRHNPFNLAEGLAIGSIDSRACSPLSSLELIEKKLAEEKEILSRYKKDRASLVAVTEDFKHRTLRAVENVKLLNAIIKNHYMSERYAGRSSTDY